MSSLDRSRTAAEKFIAGLPSNERVAIFTSSGAQTLDFTDDRQKVHEALMKLRVNTRANSRNTCPEINDYLARQIVDYSDNDAFAVVADEAVNVCHWPRRMAANRTFSSNGPGKLTTLTGTSHSPCSRIWRAVIDRMAVLPGERQVMMVSDGFINLGRDNRVESLVDRALHARVTVSALDGKGVALNMADLNAKRSYAPSGDLRCPSGTL